MSSSQNNVNTKFKKAFIEQAVFIVLLMICTQQIIYSQSWHKSKSDNPGLYVGLNFDPYQNQITNEGKYSGSDLKSDKNNSVGGSVEIGCFFSKYFRLSTGIGYVSYKTQQNLDTYQNNFSADFIVKVGFLLSFGWYRYKRRKPSKC
jgi:outer membrane protein assembly factor BamA